MKLSDLNGRYLFTTDWCGPCKTIKARLPKDTDVVIIDADEEKELAKELKLRAVPHLIVAEAGEIKISVCGHVEIEPILFPR